MNIQTVFHKEWARLTCSAKKSYRVVVGVSGGVDSLVLLNLVLKEIPAGNVTVAHFDHRVRKESSQDAQWVKKTSESLGVHKVVIGKRIASGTSEAELRKQRYAFLKKVQADVNASFVVVGHHAHDQLETLFMRLLRGTGVSGLSGISAKNGSLLRPLLKVPKEQILQYARKENISFLEDETNQDVRYFRNLIRKELVPSFLRVSDKHGGAEKTLRRISVLAEEIQEIQKENKRNAKKWRSGEVIRTPYWMRFSRKGWKKLSRGVQTAAANLLWVEMTGESLERKELSQLQLAIQRQKTTVLSGDVRVTASCDQVYLQSPVHREQLFKMKNTRDLLSLVVIESKHKEFRKMGREEEAELRLLKPGDRFRGKKMKRRLLAHRIPAPERELIPVLARRKSSEILWYFPQKGPYRKWFSVPWSLFDKIAI